MQVKGAASCTHTPRGLSQKQILSSAGISVLEPYRGGAGLDLPYPIRGINTACTVRSAGGPRPTNGPRLQDTRPASLLPLPSEKELRARTKTPSQFEMNRELEQHEQHLQSPRDIILYKHCTRRIDVPAGLRFPFFFFLHLIQLPQGYKSGIPLVQPL